MATDKDLCRPSYLIYPEEFPNILGASDHIPVVLDLKEECLEK